MWGQHKNHETFGIVETCATRGDMCHTCLPQSTQVVWRSRKSPVDSDHILELELTSYLTWGKLIYLQWLGLISCKVKVILTSLAAVRVD